MRCRLTALIVRTISVYASLPALRRIDTEKADPLIENINAVAVDHKDMPGDPIVRRPVVVVEKCKHRRDGEYEQAAQHRLFGSSRAASGALKCLDPRECGVRLLKSAIHIVDPCFQLNHTVLQFPPSRLSFARGPYREQQPSQQEATTGNKSQADTVDFHRSLRAPSRAPQISREDLKFSLKFDHRANDRVVHKDGQMIGGICQMASRLAKGQGSGITSCPQPL